MTFLNILVIFCRIKYFEYFYLESSYYVQFLFLVKKEPVSNHDSASVLLYIDIYKSDMVTNILPAIKATSYFRNNVCLMKCNLM